MLSFSPRSHMLYKNPFEKVLGETNGLCVDWLVRCYVSCFADWLETWQRLDGEKIFLFRVSHYWKPLS